MKATNAQIARHLDVEVNAIRETAEREETGEVVVILNDYRKFVFPTDQLKGEPRPVKELPPPARSAPQS